MALAVGVLAVGMTMMSGLVAAGESEDSVRGSLQVACTGDGGLTFEVLPGTLEQYDLTYGCLGDSGDFRWLESSQQPSTFVQTCDELGFEVEISGGGIVLPFPVFMECRGNAG